MHIHFVCSGNAYRSRLAEAYLKSVTQETKITVSSSGINAAINKDANGPICWYAMRLMKRNNLIPYMSWKEQQTTQEILHKVDLLICMRQPHLDYCVDTLGFAGTSYEVWDILDLNEMSGFLPSTIQNEEVDINHIKLTQQTFSKIVAKVNDLVKRIS